MSKRFLVLCCASIALTAVLAACGSEDAGKGGPAGEVEGVVEASVTSDDPADCKRLNTQRFLQQVSGESGEKAAQTCEDDVEENGGARSVQVTRVKVDGSTATAKITTGGGIDSEDLEVALVKQGGQWKLDEIVGYIDFVRERLVEDFEREVHAHPGEIPPRIAACALNVFKQGSPAELEAMLQDDSHKALFQKLGAACTNGPST